jgi:hypothetical protein
MAMGVIRLAEFLPALENFSSIAKLGRQTEISLSCKRLPNDPVS